MAFAGGHQDHTNHDRDFVATKGGQHFDGLDHVAVTRLRALQHRHQVRQVLGVHVRAGDDQVTHRAVGQARQHQRSAFMRAHTNTSQHGDIAFELVANLHARAHARVGLLQRHRGRRPCVAGAVRNLAHHQAVVRGQVVGHAAVDHGDFELLGASKNRQRQLVGEQHLHGFMGGAGLGVGDAVDGQAMVCSKNQQLRVSQHRLERVLHQAQANGQGLQFAQAATRLIAPRQLFTQRLFQHGAGGGGDK